MFLTPFGARLTRTQTKHAPNGKGMKNRSRSVDRGCLGSTREVRV